MAIWDDIGAIFTAPVDAVSDLVGFLQWVSWLFNPVNWLRMVEFVVGAITFGMGLNMAVRQKTGATVGGQVRRVVKDIPGIGMASRIESKIGP